MFDPLGSTNARIIRNRIPQWEHPGFKVGQIAETFVLGPDHVYVYETPDDYNNYFESNYYDGYNPSDLSFRYSTRGDKSLRAWAIYGDIYSGVDRCVLRYANWNLDKGSEESQSSIDITTRYVSYDYIEDLYEHWESLRTSLTETLLPNTNRELNEDALPGSEWEKCGVFLQLARAIDIRWLSTSKNDKLKEGALAVAVKIEQILVEHQASHPETIEALVMEYDRPNPQALAFFQIKAL